MKEKLPLVYRLSDVLKNHKIFFFAGCVFLITCKACVQSDD